ncbi:hypothetical protein ES708_29424 [subsurface metagenome]
MGKGYEIKHKVTRVFLADYQLLKQFSQRAGISMAEALHKLIAGKPKPEAVDALYSVAVRSMSVIATRATPVIATKSTPVTVADSHKAGVIVVKPRGGKIYV